MKIYFDKIFKLNQEYTEILIDENNFHQAKYEEIRPQTTNISGITYDDVFILETKTYYMIEIKNKLPNDLHTFNPAKALSFNGLLFSNLYEKDNCIYLYNPTENSIYIRQNAIIGEVL